MIFQHKGIEGNKNLKCVNLSASTFFASYLHEFFAVEGKIMLELMFGVQQHQHKSRKSTMFNTKLALFWCRFNAHFSWETL